jgi:hypothetical protein
MTSPALTLPTSTTHHPCGIPVADHRHGSPLACADCLGTLTLYRRRALDRQERRITVCPACGDTITGPDMFVLARDKNGSQTVTCSLTCRILWEE